MSNDENVTPQLGMQMKFTVLKNEDIDKYINHGAAVVFENILEYIFNTIKESRQLEGKNPVNQYLVINVDEPYADEVIQILKTHGHWG
jgi:hypothetical protein